MNDHIERPGLHRNAGACRRSLPRSERVGQKGDRQRSAGWEVLIDTASGVPGAIHPPKKDIEVRDHAVAVLRSTG